MNDQPAELLGHVRSLLRAFLVSERLHQRHPDDLRYNPHDFQTLAFLHEHPGARASDLGEALGVVPTTTSSVIDRLVRRGFVRKSRNKMDGRALALSLTSEGQSAAARLQEVDRRNMTMMLDALDAGEREDILRLLGKITDHIRTKESG